MTVLNSLSGSWWNHASYPCARGRAATNLLGVDLAGAEGSPEADLQRVDLRSAGISRPQRSQVVGLGRGRVCRGGPTHQHRGGERSTAAGGDAFREGKRLLRGRIVGRGEAAGDDHRSAATGLDEDLAEDRIPPLHLDHELVGPDFVVFPGEGPEQHRPSPLGDRPGGGDPGVDHLIPGSQQAVAVRRPGVANGRAGRRLGAAPHEACRDQQTEHRRGTRPGDPAPTDGGGAAGTVLNVVVDPAHRDSFFEPRAKDPTIRGVSGEGNCFSC